MRIYFERTGGFLGKSVETTVDTDSLSSDEATSWRQMVLDSSIFAMPETHVPETEAPDQFQYKVVVEVEEVSHTVETTDVTAPESLRPLLRRLTIVSRNPASSE